jgi:hypothetical protein
MLTTVRECQGPKDNSSKGSQGFYQSGVENKQQGSKIIQRQGRTEGASQQLGKENNRGR